MFLDCFVFHGYCEVIVDMALVVEWTCTTLCTT